MPAPYSLIIFDCDGVLVDSEYQGNTIFAQLLTELGLPTTTEESIQTYMGRSMPLCVEIAESKLGHAVPQNFVQEYERRCFESFHDSLQAVPGIKDVLTLLDMRAHLPYCVASSGSHQKIRTSLGITGLLSQFEGHIFSAQDVPRGKPYPDLFLFAAQQMGADARNCAVVEDSVPGIQAAIAAGMDIFGYARLTDAAVQTAAGAHTFTDMCELPALLGIA